MTQEVNTLINLMLVNLKLNALKLTLTDKELEIYRREHKYEMSYVDEVEVY